MQYFVLIIIAAAIMLTGCGETPEEKAMRLQNELYRVSDGVRNEDCDDLYDWGQQLNNDERIEAEKGCAEFVGLNPEQAVGNSTSTHSGGSNNALLYYLMMQNMMNGNSLQQSRLSGLRMGSNHLSSPMAQAYGVKPVSNGVGFEIPKIGAQADRVFAPGTNVKPTNFSSQYTRSSFGGGGHK